MHHLAYIGGQRNRITPIDVADEYNTAKPDLFHMQFNDCLLRPLAISRQTEFLKQNKKAISRKVVFHFNNTLYIVIQSLERSSENWRKHHLGVILSNYCF